MKQIRRELFSRVGAAINQMSIHHRITFPLLHGDSSKEALFSSLVADSHTKPMGRKRPLKLSKFEIPPLKKKDAGCTRPNLHMKRKVRKIEQRIRTVTGGESRSRDSRRRNSPDRIEELPKGASGSPDGAPGVSRRSRNPVMFRRLQRTPRHSPPAGHLGPKKPSGKKNTSGHSLPSSGRGE